VIIAVFLLDRMVRKYVIGMALYGCANRPFFRISVMNAVVIPKQPWDERVIEQIGSYDPMPNKHNEKMVAINYERLRYWISQDAEPSIRVAELLGNEQSSFELYSTILCIHSSLA